MRNSGWAMKLWMELRDSGFSRPSYSELRNAFTTRICREERGGRGHKEWKTKSVIKKGNKNKREGKPRQTDLCPPADEVTDRQKDTQGQVVTSIAHVAVIIYNT